MIRRYGKGEAALSGCGIALLGAAFVLWWLGSDYGLPGRVAALLSLALFIWVCLRFVPVWFSAWREPEPPASVCRGERDASAAVFIWLLIFCFGLTLLVWLIRLAQGHGESYAASLQYWTYTDSHHYLDIARDWYLSEGEWDRLVQLVFLPGYPVAIRLVGLVVRDYVAAAFLVSALSFSGAGVLLYRLFRLDYGHSTAQRAIKFLCLLPGSFFFAAPHERGAVPALLRRLPLSGAPGQDRARLPCGRPARPFTRSLGLMLFAPVFFELVQSRRGWRRFLWLILSPPASAYTAI